LPDDPFEIYHVPTDPKQEHDLRDRLPGLDRELRESVPRRRMPHPQVPRPYDRELAAPTTVGRALVPARVERHTFTGSFGWVPLLDGMTPATSETVDWPIEDQPVPAGTTALFYTGQLWVDADAAYRFEIAGPAPVVLRVHDAL